MNQDRTHRLIMIDKLSFRGVTRRGKETQPSSIINFPFLCSIQHLSHQEIFLTKFPLSPPRFKQFISKYFLSI